MSYSLISCKHAFFIAHLTLLFIKTLNQHPQSDTCGITYNCPKCWCFTVLQLPPFRTLLIRVLLGLQWSLMKSHVHKCCLPLPPGGPFDRFFTLDKLLYSSRALYSRCVAWAAIDVSSSLSDGRLGWHICGGVQPADTVDRHGNMSIVTWQAELHNFRATGYLKQYKYR